jgi:hypothetical protein
MLHGLFFYGWRAGRSLIIFWDNPASVKAVFQIACPLNSQERPID